MALAKGLSMKIGLLMCFCTQQLLGAKVWSKKGCIFKAPYQVIKSASGFDIVAGIFYFYDDITSSQEPVFTRQARPEFRAQFFLALFVERRERVNDLALNQAINSLKNTANNRRVNLFMSQSIKGNQSCSI